MSEVGLALAVERMRAHGVNPSAMASFSHYYRQLEAGALGTIPEASIDPLGPLPRLAETRATDVQRAAAMGVTAVIKLNGGLGTSMGLAGAKTALTVRDGLTFLDVIVRQVLALRGRYGAPLPLLLMDSFRTQADTAAILERYPQIRVPHLPWGFVQSAEPKLRAEDFMPVDWPADPSLEWCPPGHGDLYVAAHETGLVDELRRQGYRLAFVSNGDNLGATCDPDIAAWMLANGVSYVAEVCERTVNDRKGGHLAVRRSDGRLVLRDSAMVVPGEEGSFGDIRRHTTFHTNNLWIDLDALAQVLSERGGLLGLPIVVNRKTVDPSDPASTPVIQLETAMGAAIETFEGSRAVLVPRSRFRPVKTTNELLLIRSDRYTLDETSQIVLTTDSPEPSIDLDEHYTLVPDFDARFPHGVPSIRECTSLRVSGEVTFGAGVVCRGDVRIHAERPLRIPDGTVLHG
ncbi:MAG: UTP--glucose-1-phosphate uridylyltransferase [Dermatophilaceae bacterium]